MQRGSFQEKESNDRTSSPIFLRLPVKALLRFRCLSKSLGSEIDSPDFSIAHLKQSQKAKSGRKLIYSETKFMYPDTGIYAVDFDDLLGGAIKLNNPLKSNIGFTEVRLLQRFGLVAYSSLFGFGYDYAGDDYVVVRIEQYFVNYGFAVQVWVFDLSSNSWRKIEPHDCPGKYYFRLLDDQGVFASGALHWLSNSSRHGCDEIVSFDVSKEKFLRVFPLVRPHEEGFTLSLEALGGDLILCSNSTEFYPDEMLFGLASLENALLGKNCMGAIITKSKF
ncbi:F-box protein CPR30-like [Durio zibethinus]|uniref:F-box protein CPR30-like n=1 Tax=Durio zibethinus TaxID=66656 RepID=A0A6P5YU82_DURZI|nr:F-box protein CPR30-like [Durio zibethinus]